MRKSFLPLLFVAASQSLPGQVTKAYWFETAPTGIAQFQKGNVNTFLNERDFAISPDGTEIYFTVTTPRSSIQTIVYCEREKPGTWSQPVVAPFAGKFSDLEPAFSADGQTLYFASNRPVAGTDPKDFDIWKVTRINNTWGDPVNLGNPVNTTADEFYPSVTRNGNLYFTATYPAGPGKEDIYVSKWRNNAFEKPVPLDTAVNSRFYEFNAFVSPDENFILFTSYGRKDDSGGGDLYISFRTNETWQPAQNIREVNSPRLDYCPYVSPDGKALFFTSERHTLPSSFAPDAATYQDIIDASLSPLNGSGNIFWIDATILKKFSPIK